MLSSRGEHLGVRPADQGNENDEQSDLFRLPGDLQSALSNAMIRGDLALASQLMGVIDDLVSHPSTSGRIHELSFCRHYYFTYTQRFVEALSNNQRQHQTTRQNGYKLVPIVVPGLYLYETAIRSSIALEKPADISIQLRHMRRIRRKLGRHRRLRFARGVQHSIDAFLCYYSGRDADFEQLIDIAIEEFETDGFDSCSYFLRYQAGVKRGTERQEYWYNQAIEWAEERNIQNLCKFSRITAPVFIRECTRK